MRPSRLFLSAFVSNSDANIPLVYETSAGALINVDDAVRRSSSVVCSVCQRIGASLRCYKLNCEKYFHVLCAKSTRGKFMKDKLIAKLFHSEADRLVLRIGSLTFNHIGQLLPEQLKAFHNSEHIFP
ncbi:unnamed protein product, partial [Gongylonema pulchrum]|uniref:PHD domain-containing protein n=1 Tax=Gongylonema pulchrum TaxID=637853 RepID=A0A183EZA3_9BILA